MPGTGRRAALCAPAICLVLIGVIGYAAAAPAATTRAVTFAEIDKLPPPERIAAGADGDRDYADAVIAYYGYLRRGYQHRTQVYEWQLVSSRIIFGMALAIVLCGMWMAVRQFEAGLRGRRAPRGGGTETSTEQRYVTTLSLSPRWGLKVSSRVLGVVILLISLAFFYLYLLYVYPIHEVVTTR